jgi:hypothetical protein
MKSRISPKKTLVRALTRFHKNPHSSQTCRHGPGPDPVPSKPHPRLVRPCRQPRSVPALNGKGIHYSTWSWPNGRVSRVGRTEQCVYDRRQVLMQEELFLVLRQHPPSVLPHARCQRVNPVQGLKQSQPDRLERDNVCPGHPEPT